MVGLWCRDEKEPALQWCCCPEIQYFPCVAIEVLADDNKTDEDPSRIIKNRRTCGACCVGVPVAAGSSTAEQLPAVTLEAVWVAMPRSRHHLQDVGLLQDTFRRTIEWVVDTAGVNPKSRQMPSWIGWLSTYTERRLVWWAYGGESLEMASAPWIHKNIPRGILILSLDCARCIRLASHDAAGGTSWAWARAPMPFREWLALRGKGKGYFTQNPLSPDTFCETALNEWSGLNDVQRRSCPGDPFAMPEFVEPAEP